MSGILDTRIPIYCNSGPGKTTLSLFKDVTTRLGRAGVKGKSDDVTLYEVFFGRGPYASNGG